MNCETFLTVNDLMKRYGMSRDTIYQWIRSAKIPTIRVGKHFLFKSDDITRFEKDHYFKPEEC